MDVIVSRDGSRYNIRNDTDFARMLEETLGEDAANWFTGRIGRVDMLLGEMRPLFPPDEEIRRTTRSGENIYRLDKIGEIGTDKLIEIATIAYEIPGWDE